MVKLTLESAKLGRGLLLSIFLLIFWACEPPTAKFTIIYKNRQSKKLTIQSDGPIYKVKGHITFSSGPQRETDKFKIYLRFNVKNEKDKPLRFDTKEFRPGSDFFGRFSSSVFFVDRDWTNVDTFTVQGKDAVNFSYTCLAKVSPERLETAMSTKKEQITLSIPYLDEDLKLVFDPSPFLEGMRAAKKDASQN